MYPAKPGLLIGFHGCEETILNDIVSGKSILKTSENGHDWLGTGCYFWENNYERALDFAQNPPGKKKFKSPAVLGATIDLQFCLDLLDTSYLRLVKNSYYSLSFSASTLDQELPINRPIKNSKDLLIRELDCAVIENLHLKRIETKLKTFDSVRGVFVEGQELYPGAGFHEKNHIQICIRNPNCIKGFFIPRHELQWV
ncbi:hypothetical protein ACX0G9_04035 [Flavitalea flava]